MLEKITQNIKTIISVIVLSLTLLYFLFGVKSCSNNPKAGVTIKSDTVYITKKITVPEIKGKFENMNPKAKDGVIVYNQDLLIKYKALQSENLKLEQYKKAIEIKEYKKIYADKDSIVVITVMDSVTGKLTNQKVDFKIKPRDIEYKEKTITNTITEKLKPSFILSIGFSAQSATNLIDNKPSIGLTLGLKNKSGYSLDANYNTQNYIMLTLKKDILTFWSKKE